MRRSVKVKGVWVADVEVIDFLAGFGNLFRVWNDVADCVFNGADLFVGSMIDITITV